MPPPIINPSSPPPSRMKSYVLGDLYTRNSEGMGSRPGAWKADVDKMIALGPHRHIIWEPEFLTLPVAPGDFRFGEWKEAYTDPTRTYLIEDFIPQMNRFSRAGGIPVIYRGTPSFTERDEEIIDLHFRIYSKIKNVQFAWDALSGKGPGDLAYDMVKRFPQFEHMVEAHPWFTQTHWEGYTSLMIDQQYRQVLAAPSNYLPFSAMKEVIVIFTGNDGAHAGGPSDPTDLELAQIAIDSGHTIGWQPFDNSFFDAFDPEASGTFA